MMLLKKTQHLMSDNSKDTNLLFIHYNYGFIQAEIIKIKNLHVPLIQTLSIVQKIEIKIEKSNFNKPEIQRYLKTKIMFFKKLFVFLKF